PARREQGRRNMGPMAAQTWPEQRAARRRVRQNRLTDFMAGLSKAIHPGATGERGADRRSRPPRARRRDADAAVLIRMRARISMSSLDSEGADREADAAASVPRAGEI